jgi:hypothetical protein
MSLYLDPNGNIISDKLNKLETGIHSAHCDLHKYLPVPPDKQLRIDCNKIYTLIKDYKSLLEGILYEEDSVYFMVKDVGKAIVGKIVNPVKSISDGYNQEQFDEFNSSFNESDIELMIDKKVLEKDVDKYKMLLAHKLFPNLKKADKNMIYIRDYNDDYFVTTFNFTYLAANSSGKKIYSEVNLYHKYKFIKF